MSKMRFPFMSAPGTVSKTPRTLARRAALPPWTVDWAGLSAVFIRSFWGLVSQWRQASSARSLAWSKPRWRSRFLLTGTQVTVSNSPPSSSAAHRASSSPKTAAALWLPRNLKRRMPSRAVPSYQRGAAQRRPPPSSRTTSFPAVQESRGAHLGQIPALIFPQKGHRGGKSKFKILSIIFILSYEPAATTAPNTSAAACHFPP